MDIIEAVLALALTSALILLVINWHDGCWRKKNPIAAAQLEGDEAAQDRREFR